LVHERKQAEDDLAVLDVKGFTSTLEHRDELGMDESVGRLPVGREGLTREDRLELPLDETFHAVRDRSGQEGKAGGALLEHQRQALLDVERHEHLLCDGPREVFLDGGISGERLDGRDIPVRVQQRAPGPCPRDGDREHQH
jgi:hypothetical protein